MEEITYKLIYEYEKENWWYKVRRVIMKDLFKDYLGISNLRILDVGCGTGLMVEELSQYGNIYGIDKSDTAIQFCKSRGLKNINEGDVTKIEFDDNYFDIVIAMDILEHIKDDMDAISEIKRVTKSGGRIIFFVPAFGFLWGVSDNIGKHYRRYNKKELIDKIYHHQLLINRASYFNFFLFMPILIVRKFISFFKIKASFESEIKPTIFNKLFYYIFLLESKMLRRINFPFGVSLMIVCTKNE